MKRLVSILLVASMSVAAFAQPNGVSSHHRSNAPKMDPSKMAQMQEQYKAGREQMHERIQAEKVAFITSYIGLTPDEAQVFWPVYNEIEAQQRELQKAEFKSYHALEKCLKSGQGDAEALLNEYLSAKKANVNLHLANVERYKKILSVEKVAKIFTSEESFRRTQIGKLRWSHTPSCQEGKPGAFKGGKPAAPQE